MQFGQVPQTAAVGVAKGCEGFPNSLFVMTTTTPSLLALSEDSGYCDLWKEQETHSDGSAGVTVKLYHALPGKLMGCGLLGLGSDKVAVRNPGATGQWLMGELNLAGTVLSWRVRLNIWRTDLSTHSSYP